MNFQSMRDYFKGDKIDPMAVELHRQCALTPDIWRLEQSMYQLIFIPDDMMVGKRNHHLIADAIRNGVPVHPTCYTLERFTFWKKDLGVESFGIPLMKQYNPTNWLRVRPTPAKIRGQLFAILSPRIKKLDIHRQNGVQFNRIRQKISLPFRKVEYDTSSNAEIGKRLPVISSDYLYSVDAWMYVGIFDYWDNLIGDMFQVKECPKFEHDVKKFWVEDFYKFE